MAAILPGYEYDIFISYRQKDNRSEHWVSKFVQALKEELDATFKEDISIYFGRWSDKISDSEIDKITEIAAQLNEQPELIAYLSGHASSRGIDGINIRLSRDRARAVRVQLIEKFNINPSRIVVTWHGSRRPTTDNSTEEAKSQNRRVIAHIVTAQQFSDEFK